MDKQQKQIEEMAEIIDNVEDNAHLTQTRWDGYLAIANSEKIATELLKHYQPKIPENAVVLTGEEYINKLTKYYGVSEIKDMVRKETAEKFAEMLKETLKELELGGWVEVETKCFNKIVDEICKKFTEGEK